MKQFAILGLSWFGKNVMDELLEFGAEVMIVDKDREVIDAYRDHPVTAIVMDIANEENLRQSPAEGPGRCGDRHGGQDRGVDPGHQLLPEARNSPDLRQGRDRRPRRDPGDGRGHQDRIPEP